ncbi:divisome protein SepX/GlpR [Umezawaea beigongshangensis]|uniref:divisome protein SepX/GlpR n=1 Tax=Umezawaea beigongshangensis TaxID=2780383 RepID=UPI0018F117EF|nr:gephyrin-like molybdotransferase receptor GlpR [Umezawaea beigongshangensis]
MPSSLIIVGLVVAWLVVLVPMVVRKRQENTRGSMEEGFAMSDADADLDEFEAEFDDFEPEYDDTDLDDRAPRSYRPGRGGYDPEGAAVVAQVKYAFRRRVVALLLVAAVASGVAAGLVEPLVWWAHGAVDLVLVGYLGYLRRQVRMEEEIRARRQARLVHARRQAAGRRPRAPREHAEARPERPRAQERYERDDSAPEVRPRFQHHVRPGHVVVDLDDEDPVFVELDGPETLPRRRAVGE